MDPKISIIIPAYNAERTIAQTIRAALCQDTDLPVEVIVVDDGSTDKTAKIIQSFPSVIYLRQENAGPAAARNTGWRHSRGEIVFFTDSDCVPHPDWVRKMLPHFSDPAVGAVMGSYRLASPSKLLPIFIQAEIVYRHTHRLPRYPKVFGSYNVALRRSVLDETGGYAVGYRWASGEDNDLSYRLLRAGHKIYFEPQARVAHYHTNQLFRYLREQFRHGFWRVRMYRDHPAMMSGDDYTFWKDSVEVGLCLLILAGSLLLIICGFFAPAAPLFRRAGVLALGCSCALVLLEMIFSFRFLRDLRLAGYGVAVMTLRSFARTAGFLAGILNLFCPPR